MAVNLKIVSQVVASGTPGPAGKSAYQIAVDNGFEGTESEWLKELHPFKGWFDSVSELEEEHSAPSVGEYAYVKGATSSDPVKIYECSTEGSWSDSGRTVDTSTVQTFRSGEAVNNVDITDDSSDIEENSDKIPTAGAVADALGNVEFSTGEKVKEVGIDNEPTAGSDNLVKSGGVAEIINNQYRDSIFDLELSDDNGYAIATFSKGHIKTKNFNSDVDASPSSRGLMSAADNTKLATIEEGAEINDVLTDDNDSADFTVEDEDQNIIAMFKDGHIETKYFNSRTNSVSAEDKEKLEGLGDIGMDDSSFGDLNITDESEKIILSCKDGHIYTKKFNSKEVCDDLEDIKTVNAGEVWSRLPYLKNVPVENIRFDGGMCRIFKNWGFIGDSLGSGCIHMKEVGYATITNVYAKAITDSGLSDDVSSVCTGEIVLDATNPSVVLTFKNANDLNGKNLVASVSGGVYTPVIIGQTGVTRYTYDWEISEGQDAVTIVVSYPFGNVPEILTERSKKGYNLFSRVIAVENNKAIGSAGAVTDNTSVCSVVQDLYADTDYYPSIKLIFESNSGLSGKVLIAKQVGQTYEALATGDSKTAYPVLLTGVGSILVSYPANNVPTIVYTRTIQEDMYDFSWFQQMMRLTGCTGYNFSEGGQFAKKWCTGSDPNERRWVTAQANPKDAYVLALGCNDLRIFMDSNPQSYPCVTAYPNKSDYDDLESITIAEVMADVDLSDYNNNANSFAGWYAGIIQRLKSVRIDCHIFCVTEPISSRRDSVWYQAVRILVEQLNAYYGNNTIWLIDLAENLPMTEEMQRILIVNTHMSAFGYSYYCYVFTNYIDWIIRNNINAFNNSAVVGTGLVVNPFDTSVIDWLIEE